MFASLAFVFLFGLMGAAVFEKMKLPRIIGMLLVGSLIGPYALGLLDPTIPVHFGRSAEAGADADSAARGPVA